MSRASVYDAYDGKIRRDNADEKKYSRSLQKMSIRPLHSIIIMIHFDTLT